jgi:xylulokinase
LEFPKPGWSQQKPEYWRQALLEGIPELLQGFDSALVAGIGAGGQMHGLVVLDQEDNVIRPAILWNDGRTAKQVDFLNNEIGKEKLSELTANIAFAGFTAPKLLWMKEHEPENFGRIAKIMLPKDYINYILTGVHSCDYSDASGMLLPVSADQSNISLYAAFSAILSVISPILLMSPTSITPSSLSSAK